jgi:hypothetical protein
MGPRAWWGQASQRARTAVVGGVAAAVVATVGAAGAVALRPPPDGEVAGAIDVALAQLDTLATTAPATTTTEVVALPPPAEPVPPVDPVASGEGAPSADTGAAAGSRGSGCADGICTDLDALGDNPPQVPDSELAQRVRETGSALPPGEYPVATGPPVSVEIAPMPEPPAPDIPVP